MAFLLSLWQFWDHLTNSDNNLYFAKNVPDIKWQFRKLMVLLQNVEACNCPVTMTQFIKLRSIFLLWKNLKWQKKYISKCENVLTFDREKLLPFGMEKLLSFLCTIVFGGPNIWLEILENFCTKTFRFTWKKHGKNGPQLIRIVLCSNMDQSA